MKKSFYLVLLLLQMIPSIGFTQNIIPDTLLVYTDLNPQYTSNKCSSAKYYVLNGKREMIIFESIDKNDTIFQDSLSYETNKRFNRQLYLYNIRALPIEKIDESKAFDYFEIGDTKENFIKKLGSKKYQITEFGDLRITFPDNFSKKNIIIEYNFDSDDKLCKISRITPVNNNRSLPTNDVVEAFRLLKLQDDLKKNNSTKRKTLRNKYK